MLVAILLSLCNSHDKSFAIWYSMPCSKCSVGNECVKNRSCCVTMVAQVESNSTSQLDIIKERVIPSILATLLKGYSVLMDPTPPPSLHTHTHTPQKKIFSMFDLSFISMFFENKARFVFFFMFLKTNHDLFCYFNMAYLTTSPIHSRRHFIELVLLLPLIGQ